MRESFKTENILTALAIDDCESFANLKIDSCKRDRSRDLLAVKEY